MHPRVSVVIPAYNNARHVSLAIDSIISQDFEDYELIVADHSSADSTGEILRRYKGHPKVRVLTSTQPGGGASANWNRVCTHARGDLIKLVCGDDLISPSALREQVQALDANPSAVMVACTRDLVDDSGRILVRNRGLGGLNGLISGHSAIRASVLSGTNLFGEPACVMFRRELLERVGGWDASFPYLIDQATYTRILMHGDLVALRKPLASFRISSGQWSVRLIGHQSSQSIAFRRALQRSDPTLLSDADVLMGSLRALLMAMVRRAAYVYFRRRM